VKRFRARSLNFAIKKLLRVKGNTITLTKPRDLQHLLQSNLGEL
jgi:hypothetical protein